MINPVLLMVAFAYSAAIVAFGRRLTGIESISAYIAALAILIAVPIFPEATVQRVDRLFGVVGVGRLIVHLAFMTGIGGIFLSVVLATHRWARRHLYAMSGLAGMMAFFIVCWLMVHRLNLADMAVVFYGHGASPPTPVLWMNVVRGSGIVYIAAWALSEYYHLLHHARRRYERWFAVVCLILHVLACVAGTLTVIESVARHRGLDVAVMQRVRIVFTAGVLTASAGLLVNQIWLAPLWRALRRRLVALVAADLMQIRTDVLNLTAIEAERHLDIQYEAYAHRAVCEDVEASCRAAGIAPARTAIARMAVILLTMQREHMLEDPGYGLVTSWDDLMAEAAKEIDQSIAATAWERALQDSYVYQHVYILIFLVLDSPAFREKLFVDETPKHIQPWHQRLADIIASVMQAHGQLTPRVERASLKESRANRLAGRLISRLRFAVPGVSRFFRQAS